MKLFNPINRSDHILYHLDRW